MTPGTRTRSAAAAGLQFALPVARIDGLQELLAGGRPLLALDPEGEAISLSAIDPRAVLAFGTERDGLSDGLLERADSGASASPCGPASRA